MPAVKHRFTRRRLLAGTAAAALCLLPATASSDPATASTRDGETPKYRISASDWMMLKRQKLGALQLASDCGLDGVELDMGPLGKRPDFENNLRDDAFRQTYLATARQLKLEISSLAMSAFYGQPFADHAKAEEFGEEWIALMEKVGTKVGFLPIIAATSERAKLVALFAKLGPRAERTGVVLGLNTQLDAADNRRLLDEIDSPAVRIAFNVGEAVDAGRDVYQQLRELGADRIAQVIPTLSDGVWLQNDTRIDVPKLKRVLDEIGWSGWLVLQRSRDAKKAGDVGYNFSANARYLRSVFQGSA